MAKTSITAEELIELRYLARSLVMRGRTPVKSVIAGAHLSRFRGRGVDYLESRNYEIGDDIRNLDWRVTARTGRPHTKVFQEERERPVIVLLDLDPPMYFGTRGRLKAVLAAELAALAGWATTRRGDRIGGLVFRGAEHLEARPRGGRRGSMQFIRTIERAFHAEPPAFDAPEPPGVTGALERLRRVSRPGSLVLLISDFIGLEDDADRHLALLRQHTDLIAFQVRDGIEREIPPAGVYPISDGTNRGILDLSARDAREAYYHRVVRAGDAGAARLARFGVPVIQCATTDEPVGILSQLFGSKRRRAA
ncbi:MAG: DUF58 domain-containing protein [Pseudomonadota bacterium]